MELVLYFYVYVNQHCLSQIKKKNLTILSLFIFTDEYVSKYVYIDYYCCSLL